jgi:CRISPR-associated endonuclease/helicase Cas3
MSPLTVDDFPAFFHAVHGVDPFPWQERPTRHVAAKAWPKALDIPTGCGKTAAIDVAVFTMALEADHPIDKRQAPVRIAFVVDRRLVVDDAYALHSGLPGSSPTLPATMSLHEWRPACAI